jgi:hypothetical protein
MISVGEANLILEGLREHGELKYIVESQKHTDIGLVIVETQEFEAFIKAVFLGTLLAGRPQDPRDLGAFLLSGFYMGYYFRKAAFEVGKLDELAKLE